MSVLGVFAAGVLVGGIVIAVVLVWLQSWPLEDDPDKDEQIDAPTGTPAAETAEAAYPTRRAEPSDA